MFCVSDKMTEPVTFCVCVCLIVEKYVLETPYSAARQGKFFILFLFFSFSVCLTRRNTPLCCSWTMEEELFCVFTVFLFLFLFLCDKVEHWNTSLFSSWTMEEGGRKELSDLLINSRLLGVARSRSLSENKRKVHRLAFVQN